MERSTKVWVVLALGTLGTLLSMSVGLVALRHLRGCSAPGAQPCLLDPRLAPPASFSQL